MIGIVQRVCESRFKQMCQVKHMRSCSDRSSVPWVGGGHVLEVVILLGLGLLAGMLGLHGGGFGS
jgi:hypothetical protein